MPRGANVFEYGGGGSTLWLHDLGASLISVEHDPVWFEVLREKLPNECRVIHQPVQSEGACEAETAPGEFYDNYVHSIDGVANDSLDLVVVDGRTRVDCVRAARAKVAPGGILLLDDSDRSNYRKAGAILQGWMRTDYRGLKPGGGGTVQTSIFEKPDI
ncbi:hypothetical protein W823_23515 [Williamsia sp. D3]|nr:hypothetical protein W823_23515 [Williamsia sp. D3]